jgi:hypothetical protein
MSVTVSTWLPRPVLVAEFCTNSGINLDKLRNKSGSHALRGNLMDSHSPRKGFHHGQKPLSVLISH